MTDLEPGKATAMFFLMHLLHITGPLAIVIPVALIALRVFFRRHRGNR
jgi:hypothetical protein